MTPKTRSGMAYSRFQSKYPSSTPTKAKSRDAPPSANATG